MIPDDRSEDDMADEAEETSAEKESEEARRRDYFGGAPGEGDSRSATQLWLVSYSDFMTIMMIFFMAMYGYSHLEAKKVKAELDRFGAVAADVKAKLKDDVRVVQGIDKVTVELGEGILFESGRAALNPASTRALAAIGAAIGETKGDVIVEGHTDNVPVAGGAFRSNWELSAARAFAVIEALKEAGVPQDRLTAWGFGENRPVVDNATPENRRRNRRIDVVILKERAGTAPTGAEKIYGG